MEPLNVYDDVKNKLIEAGIPEEEVAFIHDADTEIKKKRNFFLRYEGDKYVF